MSENIATRLAYGHALEELGAENNQIIVLDADLAHATMTHFFASKYPERFFNMGIAEANMMCVAAGLATQGFIPFVSTFAMFGAGRAYEQVRNSIAYPKRNVKICCTHAGLTVGEDGGSHACIEDVSLMRTIPGMRVYCPADAGETKAVLREAVNYDGPVYIRLARLATPDLGIKTFAPGKGNVLRRGHDVIIFTYGIMTGIVLEAAEILQTKGINPTVVNMASIKPVDAELILHLAADHDHLFTVEEHNVIGGLGDAVGAVLLANLPKKLTKIGVDDCFGQSGKPSDILRLYGLDVESIVNRILSAVVAK